MSIFNNNESCQACEVLKEALKFERERNKELTETLTSLLKPIPVINDPKEGLLPINTNRMSFSRRRLELEKQDRLRMEAERSPLRARPDSELKKAEEISKLEEELKITDAS